MKYILIILLFFEVLFAGLLFAPIFQAAKHDPDALSRANLEMTHRPPEQIEAEHQRARRNRLIFKSAMGLLLAANTAGIVVAVRKMKYL